MADGLLVELWQQLKTINPGIQVRHPRAAGLPAVEVRRCCNSRSAGAAHGPRASPAHASAAAVAAPMAWALAVSTLWSWLHRPCTHALGIVPATPAHLAPTRKPLPFQLHTEMMRIEDMAYLSAMTPMPGVNLLKVRSPGLRGYGRSHA